jgi:hypothetical protein
MPVNRLAPADQNCAGQPCGYPDVIRSGRVERNRSHSVAQVVVVEHRPSTPRVAGSRPAGAPFRKATHICVSAPRSKLVGRALRRGFAGRVVRCHEQGDSVEFGHSHAPQHVLRTWGRRGGRRSRDRQRCFASLLPLGASVEYALEAVSSRHRFSSSVPTLVARSLQRRLHASRLSRLSRRWPRRRSSREPPEPIASSLARVKAVGLARAYLTAQECPSKEGVRLLAPVQIMYSYT